MEFEPHCITDSSQYV